MAEHEEYPGQSLRTRDHETIRAWAEARGAKPTTVPGTERDDRLGVLRLEFPGYGSDRLEEVSWDEWFDTFDQRGLELVYQEHTKDGNQSNFFKVVNPEGDG
jgi:hypothetical protein